MDDVSQQLSVCETEAGVTVWRDNGGSIRSATRADTVILIGLEKTKAKHSSDVFFPDSAFMMDHGEGGRTRIFENMGGTERDAGSRLCGGTCLHARDGRSAAMVEELYMLVFSDGDGLVKGGKGCISWVGKVLEGGAYALCLGAFGLSSWDRCEAIQRDAGSSRRKSR